MRASAALDYIITKPQRKQIGAEVCLQMLMLL
jgi:hypothetical protein